MAIFYSAERRGFFDPEIHKDMPADAVKISAKRHGDLLAAQEQGGEIIPDAKGRPVIRQPLVEDLRAALARDIKHEAARRITAISPIWRQINDSRDPSEAGETRFARIDVVRAASALIEEQLAGTPAAQLARFPVREHTLWPTIDGDTD